MAEIKVDEADVYRKSVPVDDRGRVTIGKEHAGERVTVVAELEDDE